MTEAPDAVYLENAIRHYLARRPPSEFYGETEPSIMIAHGLLNLSVALGTHDGRHLLTRAMAYVRDGFEGDLIDVPLRVTVEGDQPFDSTSEAEGMLLNLSAYITVQPRPSTLDPEGFQAPAS